MILINYNHHGQGVMVTRMALLIAAIVYCSMYLIHEFTGFGSCRTDATKTNIIKSNSSIKSRNSVLEVAGDEAFRTTWDGIKRNLCPAGIPLYQKFGPILFDLARDELGLQRLGLSSTKLENFWTFWPVHGTAYIMNGSDPATSTRNNTSGSFLHSPIWKCANNDIRKNLKRHLPEARDVSIHCPGKFDCWVDAIGGEENISHACIVAVVRDPITHFLSGYNEYEIRLNTDDTVNLTLKKRSAPNPLNFERFVFGDEKRFEQFIVDILTSPGDVLEDNLSHMYSMTGILSGLYKAYKRNLDAYLPSIDDLENTYPSFLKETCPHVLPESAFEPWDKEERHHHVSEADALGFRSAANAVWARGGRASRALCVIHAMDYACYDKVPVDDFCKGVYMSGAFTDAMI